MDGHEAIETDLRRRIGESTRDHGLLTVRGNCLEEVLVATQKGSGVSLSRSDANDDDGVEMSGEGF